MYESMMKNLEEDTLTEIKVYNSCLVLFHSIKGVVKRANLYSRGQLMVDITRCVKKILRLYAEKCYDKIKKAPDFEQAVCYVINTGAHSKDMLAGL